MTKEKTTCRACEMERLDYGIMYCQAHYMGECDKCEHPLNEEKKCINKDCICS